MFQQLEALGEAIPIKPQISSIFNIISRRRNQMKKNNFCYIFTLVLLLFVPPHVGAQKKPKAATLLIDNQHIATTRIELKQENTSLRKAFLQLIDEADKMFLEGPFSVTAKTKLPPSGNKHDYASYSRYWWPDPNKIDGLPYLRRDGETYPGSQSLEASDRQRIGALAENTETLGLAYYLSGEEKYAQKVAQLLRVWFLNTATRMNPNLNHAQCRPGHNTGSKSGVLDGRLLIKAFEASLLIGDASALSEEEKQGLRNWAEAYLEWLTKSELALQEAASKNNHGSYYDVQLLYFALFTGKRDLAQKVAQNFYQNRVLKQIQADGSMPEEIARTRSLFYSVFNLHALFFFAHLAEKAGVDIWKANVATSRLKAGLDFLVPYINPELTWPYPTIKEVNRMELFQLLLLADRVYPNENYLDYATHLPEEKRTVDRTQLAFPLMR